MQKRTSGKTVLHRLNGVKLETALAARQHVRALYIRAILKKSIIPAFTVEEVSIMLRFVLLVVTRTG